MGNHWEDSHFGYDEMTHYSTNYATSGADREWDTKNYDVFDGAFGSEMNGVPFVGVDFAGEINGVDFLGIDFAGEMNGVENVGVDFGVDALTVGVLGVGLLAGAASMGHHVLSIHHLLHKHSKVHAAAKAVAVHDAENNPLAGPSDSDPYQLGG